MRLVAYFKYSLAYRMAFGARDQYKLLENRLEEIYQVSVTSKVLGRARDVLGGWLGGSYLDRVTRLDCSEKNISFVRNSKVIKTLSDFIKNKSNLIQGSASRSNVIRSVKNFLKDINRCI